MSKKIRAGFIGLGNQGGAIAERMLSQGVDLRVWARRPEAMEPFVRLGAKTAPTPAALAAECDLVGVCVINDKDVRDVILGENGLLAGMKPGGVIAVHATVPPESVTELEPYCREKGVLLLDAPVSGGPEGAAAGTMTVMVGGEAATLAIAQPVFETFATKIPHLGPLGSGQMVKLLNNNLCYANVAMSISALEVAERLGMDVDRVGEVMNGSSGSSRALRLVTDEVTLRKASGPSSNVRKDINCFLDVLRKFDVKGALVAEMSASAPDRIDAFAAKRL